MLRHVIKIDEDIIKVNYYTDIEKVWKNLIYKLLKDYKDIS